MNTFAHYYLKGFLVIFPAHSILDRGLLGNLTWTFFHHTCLKRSLQSNASLHKVNMGTFLLLQANLKNPRQFLICKTRVSTFPGFFFGARCHVTRAGLRFSL